MAQGLVTHAYLEDIADAIREKLGTEDTYTPAEFADAVMLIPTGGSEPEIVSWSSGTDEQVAAMIEYAHENPNWSLQTDGGWAIGDVRNITVDAFTATAGGSVAQTTIGLAITSFDEYMGCENVMQVDFVSFGSSSFVSQMTKSGVYVTSGGYGSSGMKTETLSALFNALPQWLQDSLIEFSVLVSAGNKSSTIETVTGNKLALRSEVEVFGTSNYSFSGEGTQLPYYQTSANRIKRWTGGTVGWFLRSPDKDTTTKYCMANSSGNCTTFSASSIGTISPFGCL